MRVAQASWYLGTRLLGALRTNGACSRRCSALFERLRKHIQRLERENERLRQEREDAERQLSREQKKNAELEKEVSRLKRDLEAKVQPPSSPASLSTPSAMQPAYSKPPARKRRRKPGRKNGGRRKSFTVSGFGLKSNTSGIDNRDYAYGAQVAYPNDLFHLGASWQDIGQNFNPELGYFSRRGVRITTATARWWPRPKLANIRQMLFIKRYKPGLR